MAKDHYHKRHPGEHLGAFTYFYVTLATSAPIGMLMGVLVC